MSLSVSADDGQTTRYGKSVSDLQSDIVVGSNAITGTLKYVTGYTGYSGVEAEQSGNYLALNFTISDGASLYGKKGSGSWVNLTSDKYVVVRVTNKDTDTLQFKTTKAGSPDVVKTFSLAGLTLEAE